MFQSLGDRLQSVFEGLRGRGRLTEADVKAALREVRVALLEADVNLEVAREFTKRTDGGMVLWYAVMARMNAAEAERACRIIYDLCGAALALAGFFAVNPPICAIALYSLADCEHFALAKRR